ncbi:MAG: class I SAM-dependent methyltransferase [Thermoplasmata archaeon]|nr:class I SAM-dependent methyltransferase [Thermoplasmata archaeon]MCI4359286.1 class I SAM-dependent methyltransferase [Thermoplasmata archaeon]
MVRRRGLPEPARRRWRQVYEQTPYRQLPWFSSRPFEWIRRSVSQHWLADGGRVLDVGCGAGTNSLFLARSGYRVSGIDVAPSAISAAAGRARRLRTRADFRVADALALPYPRSRFAGAIDVGCFHTLPIRSRTRYVSELARVLRPGGRLALAWVAREYTRPLGPSHRPSVSEVTGVFEERFQFLRTEFLGGRWGRIPAYGALLERRAIRQPPPR